MAKIFLALVFLSGISHLTNVAQAAVWQAMTDENQPQNVQFHADHETLKNHLWQAPPYAMGLVGTAIELPLPNGDLLNTTIFQDNVVSADIAALRPDLRSFRVYDENQRFIGRINFSRNGLRAIIEYQNQLLLIGPDAQPGSYRSFFQHQAKTFSCHNGGSENLADSSATHFSTLAHKRFGNYLRTFRIAVSATHGYYAGLGQNDIETTFDEMITAIDRVNFLFERDLGIRLIYASDTSLISTQATDSINGSLDKSLSEHSAWINGRFDGQYDIGHVLSTSPGGIARMNSACGVNKAQGATGLPTPNNDKFYFEYLAHEIGHQLGASHTFNAGFNAGSCDANNRQGPGSNIDASLYASFEPGSGSTIMAYAGICSPQNIQSRSDHYFHGGSIEQIRNFVERHGQCGDTIASFDNNMPIANAGDDYIIPANTPFMLHGSAHDNDDGDNISYTWEQMDLGSATSSVNDMHTDKGTGPLIRSRPPTTNPARSIPAIDAVLEGNLTKHIGERLPSKSRTLNFRLTVRSGAHGVDQDDMQIQTYNSAGPFVVTQPNGGHFNGLSAITVNWNVANTQLPPILCSNVDISLTADQGISFMPLVDNVSNNGTANVVLPNSDISNAYIKVQCSNNIFFNTNPGAINISAIDNSSTFSIHALQDALHEGTSSYTTFSFNVVRTGDTSSSGSVQFHTESVGETPATAEDFLGGALPWGELFFAAGETVHRIDIKVRGDTINEPTEHFLVRLSNPTNEHTIAIAVAQNSILNGNAPSSRKKARSGQLNLFFLLLLVTAFLRREAFS